MAIKTALTEMLGIRLPIVMAPMFLVSNEKMMEAALDAGIAGAFPTLNYRENGQLADILDKLNLHLSKSPGTYGVNLIVQKTNPLYIKHLEICVEKKVPFYITSLGNPKEVIEKAHAYGAKVFCDITNLEHAEKVHGLGCDGFIAVGQGAGGHAGPYPLQLLIPSLREKFPDTPVIAAGGVATGIGLLGTLALGAAGASIGTLFIASIEAGVNDAYKNAIVNSGMQDIVLTEKISGTPCNIINTPNARKMGYKQNWFEKLLSQHPTTKKYFKMLVQIRGMKKLEKAVRPGSYHSLWCAGQTAELIHEISTCKEIITRLENQTKSGMSDLENMFK